MKSPNPAEERELIATLERRMARAQAIVEKASAAGKDAPEIRQEIEEYRKTLAELKQRGNPTKEA